MAYLHGIGVVVVFPLLRSAPPATVDTTTERGRVPQDQFGSNSTIDSPVRVRVCVACVRSLRGAGFGLALLVCWEDAFVRSPFLIEGRDKGEKNWTGFCPVFFVGARGRVFLQVFVPTGASSSKGSRGGRSIVDVPDGSALALPGCQKGPGMPERF